VIVRAVDTNVVARFILGDDPAQGRIAADIVADGVFVPITVLMETAWLLGSVYGQSRAQIHNALITFLQIEAVTVRDREAVSWALERYARGADFEDMLHIAASLGSEAFVTFDRSIAKRAGSTSPVPVETLA
jgi:predicted nucleic-acid-binding protein